MDRYQRIIASRPPPVSIKTLSWLFLLTCEHSIIMLEDFSFVLTTQITLLTVFVIWIIGKRKLSIGLLMTLIFVLSVVWKWILLVKKAQSKKLATMFYLESSILARKTGSDWVAGMLEYVWPRQASSCEAYYEAMHVHSFWEVSPLDALVETVSDVCFKPLTGLGMGLSGFFNAFIAGTPFIWKPVVLILGTIILVVIILTVMGYRFSSLFFTIEPTVKQAAPKPIVNSEAVKDENRIKMTNESLPYPTGPSFLDNLVPKSVSHKALPKYRVH